ncbi:hypothetical protein B1748_00045 [Paenibacillus sp. MY03]|uniref:LamG-like jellyroll fold domain-containing protein n=1 Tax=Paenibacillus sp. MY03 TaxID=302980 RepID=UPI000B3CF36B|nr:LamG-like jellyroll fold domain-containing protein [Paenibacillus sp. MY03]OUS78507.1 hypothetical protein B1748_00045 [Paenibacillus sp. MY03]
MKRDMTKTATALIVSALLSILFAYSAFAWVPSPETWTNIPDKWSINVNGGTNELVDSTSKSGTRSNLMTGNASTGTYVVLDKPWVPLTTSKSYVFQVWHKTSGGYTGTPKINVMYLSRWGAPVPNYADSQQTIVGQSGDHDWQLISATLTIPVSTAKVRIELVSETGQGSVWFDDVSVASAEAPTTNLVQNPGFETIHAYMSDSEFFSKLNLDAPGLASVKSAVQANDPELAKANLLAYYKARTAPLQLGDRNGARPPADVHYDTYMADLMREHYLTQRDGQRFDMGSDVNWAAFAPDGSTSTLAVKNYFAVSAPAETTMLAFHLDQNAGAIASDASGKANHGAIQGTPAWTNGKFDYGLNVNSGTYVTVSDRNSLDLSDQLSMEGWFKWDGTSYDGYGIHKGNAYSLQVVNGSGHPAARVYVDGQWREAVADQALTSGVWHHVAMTYSAVAQEIKLYVNGVLNQTTVLPAGLNTYEINNSANALAIGRDASSSSHIFTGAVDGIVIADIVKDSFALTGPSPYPGALADAYWYTGEEVYAKETIDLMLDWYKDNHFRENEFASDPAYAKESPISAVVHPGWQSLTEGIRLQNWINLLNSVRDSSSLTSEALVALLKSMYEQAEDLRHRHQTGDNGAIAQMIDLYQFAVLFPEFQSSAQWKSYSVAMLNSLIQNLVYPDGAEIELTTLYQVATIANGFLTPYRLEQLNQWNNFPPSYKDRLEKMYQYLMYIAKPDGTAPLINDSNRTLLRGRLLEGAALFNRQDMKYVATKGTEGLSPAYTSYGFPYAGQYVMRSGWDANALYLALDAGPMGVSHYHEDKLSFDLSAYGKNFISDPGLFTYDGDKWTRYFASTVAHNTMMVDGLGQNRSRSGPFAVTAPVTDTSWLSGTGFDYASGQYAEGYGPALDKSAIQKRAIFFAKPDYWIIRDRVAGTGTHTLQNRFQFEPMGISIDPITKVTTTTNVSDANLQIIPVDPSGLAVSYAEGQDSAPPASAYANDANTRLLMSFDEGTGTVAGDSSSYGNNGTFVGTPNWESGKFGDSVAVNGTNYIRVPDSSSLDITNEITVEGWFKWDGTKGLNYGVNKRNAYGLAIVDTGGLPTAWVYVDGAVRTIQSYRATVPNQWYHLALTYSASTRQLNLYVNGEKERTIVLPQGLGSYAINASDFELRIGTDYYGNSLSGNVDDVRISDTIRDFPQIGGWYSPLYVDKHAAPQVQYVKQAANLPDHMDFVMYPSPAGAVPSVTVTRLPVAINGSPASASQSSAMTVSRSEGTDYIALSEPDSENKTFGEYATDAEVAFIRKDATGNLFSMSLANGSVLKDTSTGDELVTVLSPHMAANLTVVYDGTALEIDTSLNLPVSESLKVYAPSAAIVQVNGQGISFQTIGNYVIVGEAAYATDANTVLLLHADEGQGGVLNDSSGNANHGAVTGTANWTSSKFGDALTTNGGTGYIRVEDSSSLDITDELTIEGWVKCNSAPCTGYLMQKGYAYGVKVGDGNGSLVATVYVDGGLRTAVSTSPLSIGMWHHVAMTYSATSRTINLYVDGELKASTTLSGLNTYHIQTDNQWLAIGRDSNGWGGGNIFSGFIDEVRISNVLRSDFSLNKPYATDANTVLLIHADEGQGGVLNDSSSSANHGAVTGTAQWTSSKFGDALTTNGGTGYIRVEDSDSLDITDELTIEGWVKCNSAPCTGYLLQKGYTYGLKVGDGNGSLVATVYVDGGLRTAVSTSPLSIGVWHHVAMTYSAATRTINLYVDGELKASTTLSGLNTYTIQTDNQWLAIGRDSNGWGGGNIFSGFIDEVRISNVARSDFPFTRRN